MSLQSRTVGGLPAAKLARALGHNWKMLSRQQLGQRLDCRFQITPAAPKLNSSTQRAKDKTKHKPVKLLFGRVHKRSGTLQSHRHSAGELVCRLTRGSLASVIVSRCLFHCLTRALKILCHCCAVIYMFKSSQRAGSLKCLDGKLGGK